MFKGLYPHRTDQLTHSLGREPQALLQWSGASLQLSVSSVMQAVILIGLTMAYLSVARCLFSIHRPDLWGLCSSSPGEDRCVAGMRGLPDPPAVKGLWMLQGLEVGIASGAIWGCSTLYINSGLPSLKSLA